MSTRSFAQINCGLLKSQKMRLLSHVEKWAYLCAHLTPFASFTGVFHYPNVMWAHDAQVGADELAHARERLIEVGLIEYDQGEETIRIVGFHRQRPPENASRCISLAGDLYGAFADHGAGDGMLLRCAAEFAVAAVQRAQAWKPDSPELPKLREALRPFLASVFQDAGDNFLSALADELRGASKATRTELCALLPPLLMQGAPTVSAASPDRVGTRDLDKTRLRQDEDENEDEEKTARFRETETAPLLSPLDRLRSETMAAVAPRSGPRVSTLRSPVALAALKQANWKRKDE